jgi:hypothetical protein
MTARLSSLPADDLSRDVTSDEVPPMHRERPLPVRCVRSVEPVKLDEWADFMARLALRRAGIAA